MNSLTHCPFCGTKITQSKEDPLINECLQCRIQITDDMATFANTELPYDIEEKLDLIFMADGKEIRILKEKMYSLEERKCKLEDTLRKIKGIFATIPPILSLSVEDDLSKINKLLYEALQGGE